MGERERWREGEIKRGRQEGREGERKRKRKRLRGRGEREIHCTAFSSASAAV